MSHVGSRLSRPSSIASHQPPAKVSASDTSSVDGAAHQQAIQTLQNRSSGRGQALNHLLLLADIPLHSGPEYLQPDALHRLGFASATRSRQIMGRLMTVGLTDRHGAWEPRRAEPSRAVAMLEDVGLGKGRDLTEAEARGLLIYLTGVQDNLHSLGRSIGDVPAHLRPNWFFYAGITATSQHSRQWANTLRYQEILDRAYLPVDGGRRFETFGQAELNLFNHRGRARDRSKRMMAVLLHKTREALFPLPSYAFMPQGDLVLQASEDPSPAY